MDSKIVPPAVFWHEGMFLQPHHFQQAGIRAERLVDYKCFLLWRCLWGIRQLEIDAEAIAGGTFRITALEAVLRDGLVVTHELIAQPLVIDLAKRFEDRSFPEDGLLVFLAIARSEKRSIEVEAGEQVGHPLRYRAQAPVKVADLSSGADEAPISFLHLKARLFLEDEDREGYETLPIARLVSEGSMFKLASPRWKAGEKRWDRDFPAYVPPTILVDGASPISELVEKLCDEIRRRATEAAGQFDAASGHHDAAPGLENRIRALGLVSELLTLEQLPKLGCYRPLDVYLGLCRIYGQLSVLRQRLIIPPTPPRYEHDDLWRVFLELDQSIRSALDDIFPSEWVPKKVDGQDGKFRILDLAPEELDRPMVFWIDGSQKLDYKVLAPAVANKCVICPAKRVLVQVDNKIPGIARSPLAPPPVGLPLERGVTVFRLDVADYEFKDELKKDKLAFYFMHDADDGDRFPRPKKIHVYVKKH